MGCSYNVLFIKLSDVIESTYNMFRLHYYSLFDGV